MPASHALTFLITGCSSGIGLALARECLRHGHNVIATSRNPSRTPELVAEIESSASGSGKGKWMKLDVTASQDEVTAVVKDAWRVFVGGGGTGSGGIDVLVNNAAYSVLGAVEDIDDDAVRAQFNTNFLGVLRVIRAVVPLMRERERERERAQTSPRPPGAEGPRLFEGTGTDNGSVSGGRRTRRTRSTIVNISSLLGVATWPACGIYGASKHALEGASEALALELAPFNIRVLLFELGSFRTNFLAVHATTQRGVGAGAGAGAPGGGMNLVAPSEAYAISMNGDHPVAAALREEERKNGTQDGDPDKAAARIVQVVDSDAGQGRCLRIALGRDAWEGIWEKSEIVRSDLLACKEMAYSVQFD